MPSTILDTYSVSSLQILDEQGRVDPELEPKLDAEQLLKLYRWLQLARLADERMLKLQRQGRIGTFAPSTGQEAATIGPAFAMGTDDWLIGSFRELGARLVRGESFVSTLMFHNGFEEGNLQTQAGPKRLLPISIIVAAQLLHATGIAYAMKLKGETAAVVAFVGDGGTSQGDFHEALNFASVWQVPVVFIVQNNQWAISVPRSKQTHARSIAQKAIGYDMPGIQVDGNDVLAMYHATSEALQRARDGQGPTLIEAMTYRLMMHTTADDPKKYRDENETEALWSKEPLRRMRTYLENKKIWDQDKQTQLEAELKAEVDAAVTEFEKLGEFAPELPFAHVYGTEHDVINEQRVEFLANLSTEKSHD